MVVGQNLGENPNIPQNAQIISEMNWRMIKMNNSTFFGYTFCSLTASRNTPAAQIVLFLLFYQEMNDQGVVFHRPFWFISMVWVSLLLPEE